MRLNRYLAMHAGLSRRRADDAIVAGQVTVNGTTAVVGQTVETADRVQLDGLPVSVAAVKYVLLHKPAGVITSRVHQGTSRTIYDLLPKDYLALKPVGRLDKDSSGALLLTNDGELANRLTHPRYGKTKRYRVSLNRPLSPADVPKLASGVELTDGPSRLKLLTPPGRTIEIELAEGRNRQVRRTFDKLGYRVEQLVRIKFGNLELAGLAPGKFRELSPEEVA